MDRLPITLLPRELRTLTGANTPGYRRLYALAASDQLPGVERGTNGRWTFDPAALPQIAAVFAGGPKAPAPAAIAA